MVQFLLGSEIIFQIISRFGLAKLQNEGGALKDKIWTDSLSAQKQILNRQTVRLKPTNGQSPVSASQWRWSVKEVLAHLVEFERQISKSGTDGWSCADKITKASENAKYEAGLVPEA